MNFSLAEKNTGCRARGIAAVVAAINNVPDIFVQVEWTSQTPR
jgi:hypothetical protein